MDITANLTEKSVRCAHDSREKTRSRRQGRDSWATCLDGSFKLEQDGLGDEDFAGLGAEIPDFGLQKLDLLARSAAPHLEEAIDYRVEIDVVLVRHCKVLASR